MPGQLNSYPLLYCIMQFTPSAVGSSRESCNPRSREDPTADVVNCTMQYKSGDRHSGQLTAPTHNTTQEGRNQAAFIPSFLHSFTTMEMKLSSLPILLLLLLLCAAVLTARAHEHHGESSSCEMDPNVRLLAEYREGVVTVDGQLADWDAIDGSQFELRPALDPDEDKKYPNGEITVKAIHDGSNIYFALQVDGEYAYAKGESNKCPSVALMFQVGANASYDSMGGCPNLPGSCTGQSCQGHEVDIMHFSIGTAIPGRLYGGNIIDNTAGNGGDRFGHLVDVYAWNPHCRYLDGLGPDVNYTNALNDWHGAWWHSSLLQQSGYIEENSPYATQGQKGTYYFEFSRPLRTMDRFQQDVQFTIGQVSKVAVAFWYPTGGQPWGKSQHYSGSCNWIPLDVASPSPASLSHSNNGTWDAMTAFSLLLSVVAFCLSIFVGYWVSKRKDVPFMPIEMAAMR